MQNTCFFSFFWSKHMFFLAQKISILLNKIKFNELFEKTANFICVVHQNSYLQLLEIKFIFFLQNTCNCFKLANFLNVLRNVTVSDAFYSKFATFSNFWIPQFTFRETHLIFLIRNTNPKDRKPHLFYHENSTFWETLLIHSILRLVCHL